MTSFVRADVIPQLADADEVLARIDVPDDVAVSVLIPNERGLDNALRSRERFHEINVFLSASETHNRKNVNRSIAESLAGLETRPAPRPRRGAALRGRHLGRLRLPLRGPRPARARARHRRARCVDAGAAGDRLRRHDRHGQPAAGARVLRRGRARRSAPRSSSPRTSTTRAARASPTSWRRSRPACESFESTLRRARRLPRARRRDRQHRHGGPRLDAPRDGRRDRHRPGRPCSPRARAARDVLGRPLGSHTLVAGPVDWREGA